MRMPVSVRMSVFMSVSVLRGSILSVKLGQELDRDEYGDPGEKLDERPAIDPGPGIRWEWSTEDARYAALPDLVAWLVDALLADGYRVTDPVSLQAEKRAVIPKLHTLGSKEGKHYIFRRLQLICFIIIISVSIVIIII